MERLHLDAMEELAGILSGAADIVGTLEFERSESDPGRADAEMVTGTDNFRVRLMVTTHARSLESEEG